MVDITKVQVARLYHSGAILTSEGYVITTGSEMQNYIDKDPNCFPKGQKNVCTSPYEYRIERYTPYYLVTGKPRPVIKTAPVDITFSSTFLIEIRPGVNINRVTFLRYSTTTHNTNTDQRFIELEIIGVADGKVGVKMPSDGAIAPPGNWMLFVLSNGVPSVAKTVYLHDGPQRFISDEDLKSLKPLTGDGIRISAVGSSWTIMVLIMAVLWL